MKIYTFDETTYPGIPDEIGPETRQTNRFCDPELAAQTYAEHLDEWVMGEELGFDGAFVNEHHFTYFNLNPSSTVLASAIAARTKRMKVGVIGHVLPLRHPVQTAEEFAQLDVLTGGSVHRRHRAGLPPGVCLLQRGPVHRESPVRRVLRDTEEVPDRGVVRLRRSVLPVEVGIGMAQAPAEPISDMDARGVGGEHRVRRRASHTHLQNLGVRWESSE